MTTTIDRKKHTIDANGQIVGRLATQIAHLLRGKNKVNFNYNTDCGDIVEVVNIRQIKTTGKKMEQKIYYRHSGYIGNMKQETMAKAFEKDPSKILKLAVSRMLPKNKLRAPMLKRLTITK